MKRKLINKFILILSISLITMISYTIGKYIILKQSASTQVIQQQKTKEETKVISKELLIKKLNNENQMLVLSGELEVELIYSNKDIQDDDVNFKWIKDWFSKMKSKDLKVNATYTYQFHYDLKDLDISIDNNEPYINLSKNRLSCEVELVENKTFYSDRVGIFESQFTPQEVNSINERTKTLILNEIQNKTEFRDKAVENVKNNINELLDINCNFNVAKYDVVEYNNKVVKIN